MKMLFDADLWLAIAVTITIVVLTIGVCLVLRHVARMVVRWLGNALSARLSARTFRSATSISRLIWGSVMIGGVATVGVTLAIWQVSIGDGLYDPVMSNPLFWLTWLAITVGIGAVGTVCGFLLRSAVARMARRPE
jgi:hypothetical protein